MRRARLQPRPRPDILCGSRCPVVLGSVRQGRPASASTRTYRARFILSGGGETAPLGATVTLQLKAPDAGRAATVEVPLAALFDTGSGPSVWRYDSETETVKPQIVKVARMGEERADVVAGLNPGDRIVALGAHLLKADQKVRQAPPSMTGAVR